jgi:hypothetical protein
VALQAVGVTPFMVQVGVVVLEEIFCGNIIIKKPPAYTPTIV